MDEKTKALRQHLRVKLLDKEMKEKNEKEKREMKEKKEKEKREMEEKKEKARLEMKGKKCVDAILTTDEQQIKFQFGGCSISERTRLERERDPGYEPKAIGVPNEYGRYDIIPYAEALERARKGTLYRGVKLNKYGAKSIAKQINSKRVKIQFNCENCHKCAKDEVPLKQCGHCEVIAYCSRECQVKHWKKLHKHECARMKEEGRTWD
jgi:hypothetical protein